MITVGQLRKVLEQAGVPAGTPITIGEDDRRVIHKVALELREKGAVLRLYTYRLAEPVTAPDTRGE